MAILTQTEITEAIKAKELVFLPALDVFQIHPHSIDMRLGFTFLIPQSTKTTPKGREVLQIDHFDPSLPPQFEVLELEQGQYFDLLPGEFVTVSTLESVKIPNNLMAVLYPRSSTNRRGLSVDLSGIIDAGYEGQLIIPLRNNTRYQTIRLYPGERICQLVFEQLSQPVVPRESRYHKKDIIDGVRMGTLPNEREIEMELIKHGDIRKLKAEHSIRY